jgi:hypothetical protein
MNRHSEIKTKPLASGVPTENVSHRPLILLSHRIPQNSVSAILPPPGHVGPHLEGRFLLVKVEERFTSQSAGDERCPGRVEVAGGGGGGDRDGSAVTEGRNRSATKKEKRDRGKSRYARTDPTLQAKTSRASL